MRRCARPCGVLGKGLSTPTSAAVIQAAHRPQGRRPLRRVPHDRAVPPWRAGVLRLRVAKSDRENLRRRARPTGCWPTGIWRWTERAKLIEAAQATGVNNRGGNAMSKQYKSEGARGCARGGGGRSWPDVGPCASSRDVPHAGQGDDAENADIRELRCASVRARRCSRANLNATGLVSQWERGEKRPRGPSLKLLLVAKNGLAAVA